MIGAWTINVGGEGRLAPQSLVAREGTGDWHEAHDEPEFSSLFASSSPAPAAKSAAATPAELTVNGTAAPVMEAAAPQRAQIAIFLDLKSRVSNNFEQTIMAMGPAYKILPNVWIVSTPDTANAVRNRLVQELGKLDSLFVIDATRGKSAWFNFGPEADAKIRRVWQKTS